MTTITEVKPLAPDDPRVSVPLYTLPEAAHYLGVGYERLRHWVRPAGDEGDPLVTAFPKPTEARVLPFAGFAEAFILSIAYRAGMHPSRIRKNVHAIKAAFEGSGGLDYVLASSLLFHDRAELLIGNHLEHLEVPRLRQLQLTETVKDQLELVTYGEDGFATRLALPIFKKAKVVIDPAEAFGAPIVERTGTRIQDVVNQFFADEDIADIAYDFDLKEEEVQDLIRAWTKPTS